MTSQKHYSVTVDIRFLTADSAKDAAVSIAEAVEGLGRLEGDGFADNTAIEITQADVSGSVELDDCDR